LYRHFSLATGFFFLAGIYPVVTLFIQDWYRKEVSVPVIPLLTDAYTVNVLALVQAVAVIVMKPPLLRQRTSLTLPLITRR
jgi:hypothetical protein